MEKEAKKLYKSTKQKFSKAKRSYVCKTLKDVIRGYRNCKTASDERAYVKKESAHIRDLFREEDKAFRRQNVLKLLFFHMNGYMTDWGQIQCLKLCASPKFKDKRIGYLGLTILLDENQDILMMMTNCLKMDMGSSDTKVCALALTAMANISTPEMIRDLMPDVIRLMMTGTPYLRKKAALLGARAVRKVPELSEEVLSPMRKLMAVRSGAVLLTTTTMLLEICKSCPNLIPQLRMDFLPGLRDLLRELNTAGYDPDLTVGGVTDPFMQVKALQAIGILAQGDPAASESVVDVLSQVAANTDSAKNSGTAVIAECVKTILKINAPPSLRSLAFTNLGKFLLSKESNSRYIALCHMAEAFKSDPDIIKAHTNTIVECLHESDPSVRHRAIDLVFAVADQSNVQQLTEEALAYVEGEDVEGKEATCLRLMEMVDRLGPGTAWKVDIFIRLLRSSGSYVLEALLDLFSALIASDEASQPHVSTKLFNEALTEESSATSSDRLMRFALFIFGEYGDQVVGAGDGTVHVDQIISSYGLILKKTRESAVTEDLVRSARDEMLARRQLALLSVSKLMTKVVARGHVGEEYILQTRQIIASWRQALDSETQQRSCETSTLLTVELESSRTKIFAPLPPCDIDEVRKAVWAPAGSSMSTALATAAPASSGDLLGFMDAPAASGKPQASASSDPLSDLLGLSALPPSTAAPALPAPDLLALPTASAPAPSSNSSALLDDLFGSSSTAKPSTGPAPPVTSAAPSAAPSSIPAVKPAEPAVAGQAANGAEVAPKPVPLSKSIPGKMLGPFMLCDKDGFGCTIQFYKTGSTPQKETKALACFVNKSPNRIERFVFLLSVPKYMKLHMLPASATTLEASGGTASQEVSLTNTLAGEKPLQLRYRIEYLHAGGSPQQQQGVVSDIPKNL